jgi:manganese/iron transport system permease protein
MPPIPRSITVHTLTDPLSDGAFVRALIDVTGVALIAGVVGTLIVVRGLGFLGDALAHAIFPGVVIAFIAGGSLLLGALLAAVVTATLMGVLTANTRVRDNTAIGVIFTAAFALGVVVLSGRSIDAEELEGILFGDPLGATAGDVMLTMAVAAAVLVAVVALLRPLVAAAFDPTGARAMGLPVLAIDIALLAVTALTVVVSFKAVGNILVIALLITPAATARLYTDRLKPMMALAVAVALAASAVGLYAGYHHETSAGGVIVLVITALFMVSWLFAPRTGIVTSAWERRAARLAAMLPEAEAEVLLASPELTARGPH